MPAQLAFQVLGPIRGRRAGAELALGSPQQRLVLAALVLAEESGVSAERLIEVVWGDQPPRSAASTLHTYISRLRSRLGPDSIATMDGLYVLGPNETDMAEFDRRVAEAGTATDPATTARLLGEALALWTGEPLSGLPGRWADDQRTRLDELRLAVVERRIALRLELGQHTELIAELTSLCLRYRLRESLRGSLMLALYRARRQAEALAVYDDIRAVLADELGVDPSPMLVDLHRKVLRADPDLGATRAPARPESAEVVPAQLPFDTPDFAGRAGLIDTVTAHFDAHDGVMVIAAISGIGGVGKTALSLRLAHRLSPRYPSGQLYLDLRGTDPEPTTPQAALAILLRSLGIDDLPDDPDERVARYRSVLADRRLLLVLDNVRDTAQIRSLLPGSSGCAVIVTGRTKLPELPGVHQIDLDVLEPNEAVDLFRRIVGAARADAERAAVLDVVAACGHLPLAVRIAAARLTGRPNWTVERLAGRLADQRRRLAELKVGDLAVEATFALSYRQLDGEHARAFRMLAVPDAPDLHIDAVSAILDRPMHETEELVEDLVDLNLLESHAPDRYRYHDLLKLFAQEQADTAERADAVHRLTDHYAAAAKAAWDAIDSPDGGEAVRRWRMTESAGLLSTARQAIRQEGVPVRSAGALLDGIRPLMPSSGYIRDEEFDISGELVAAATDDPFVAGRAHWHRATIHIGESRFDAAEREAALAMDLSSRAGDHFGIAQAASTRAHAVTRLGRPEEALTDISTALREFGTDDAWKLDWCRTLSFRGRINGILGRPEAALPDVTESVARFRRYGNVQMLANALYQQGTVLRDLGRHAEALAAHREALRLREGWGYRLMDLRGHYRIAELYLLRGEYELAAQSAEYSVTAAVAIRDSWSQAFAQEFLGKALFGLGQPDRATAVLRDAAAIYDRLELPADAEGVRGLLETKTQPAHPPAR